MKFKKNYAKNLSEKQKLRKKINLKKKKSVKIFSKNLAKNLSAKI